MATALSLWVRKILTGPLLIGNEEEDEVGDLFDDWEEETEYEDDSDCDEVVLMKNYNVSWLATARYWAISGKKFAMGRSRWCINDFLCLFRQGVESGSVAVMVVWGLGKGISVYFPCQGC